MAPFERWEKREKNIYVLFYGQMVFGHVYNSTWIMNDEQMNGWVLETIIAYVSCKKSNLIIFEGRTWVASLISK